nr:formate/nitrite transporter family protein [Flavimaribacter sediminis]
MGDRKVSETKVAAQNTLKPREIADFIRRVGASRVRQPALSIVMLSILAGVFIGLGGLAFTQVTVGTDPAFGPTRFLGGVVFSLGLILVVVGGAELFTGNALLIMPMTSRLISPMAMTGNWALVYVGNFAGSVLLAIVVAASGVLEGGMAERAAAIVEAKAALEWQEALFRGILCNMLVCLAVWLSVAAKTVIGKVAAVIWPIATFVLLGLEHSVANMYLFPQGMAAGADVGVSAFAQNLFIVTIGNIIGGALVGVAYGLAYPADR